MAWETFERVAFEVLIQDDFPRLRKVGGTHDKGIDAADEAFYSDQARLEAVVQVTMQRAQEEKFRDTIKKLKTNRVSFRQLVLVYKHPVSSPARSRVQAAALELEIAVDIRDESYLVAQLAKPNCTIFARHFGDVRDQVERLFRSSDPLGVTGTRSEQAMLATVAAYVLHPQSRLVRTALFDKTVLAGLAAAREPLSLADLASEVRKLLPEETVDDSRIRAAVTRLCDKGECEERGDQIAAAEASLTRVAEVLGCTRAAYDDLRDHVLAYSTRAGPLDDASRGYLERNLRRAVLALLQTMGPLEMKADSLLVTPETRSALLPILAENLSPDTAKRALVALAGYVEDEENASQLALFVRAYGALAIRNLDPLGRRWQQSVLKRTEIALDTDAVLTLLIEELPQHDAVRKAIGALETAGVSLVVSEDVVAEVVSHIENAPKTFRRFRTTLEYMSPAMVDSEVWHAVVQGFYHARKNGQETDFGRYWRTYFDRSDPVGYIRHLIGRRARVMFKHLDDIPREWEADFERIAQDLLVIKERNRLKAAFRDPSQMERRIRSDVRMAMHLASRDEGSGRARPLGYVASEDKAFRDMEQHSCWKPRPRVHLWTRMVTQLAEVVCGETMQDDQIVALLFEPATAAAAQLLQTEIAELTKYGVDLKTIRLDRLSWDIEKGLLDDLMQPAEGRDSPALGKLAAALHLARSARERGYAVRGPLGEMVDAYSQLVDERDTARTEQQRMEKALHMVVVAGAGLSKKGKRRARRKLRELGIVLPDEEPGDRSDSDQNAHGPPTNGTGSEKLG
jgi:hypothetical protein